MDKSQPSGNTSLEAFSEAAGGLLRRRGGFREALLPFEEVCPVSRCPPRRAVTHGRSCERRR
eukprot:6086082-Pyramimonas_sp.AAC.1